MDGIRFLAAIGAFIGFWAGVFRFLAIHGHYNVY